MQREKIDYIYFEEIEGRRRSRVWRPGDCWQFLIKREYGCNCLWISRIKPSNEVPSEKWGALKEKELRYLKKGLLAYDVSQAVVAAEEQMSHYLELSNLLFQARKQECLMHARWLFKWFGNHRGEEMSIVVDSCKWKANELLALMIEARNYYRNINLVVPEDRELADHLAVTMYEEWGVVVQIYTGRERPPKKQDFVLFLVQKWERKWRKECSFLQAYLVTEQISGQFTRQNVRSVFMEQNGHGGLYSGFVYESRANVCRMSWL